MDGFWTAFWKVIVDWTVWAWFVGSLLSGVLGLVLGFTLWRKPKWENRLKWVKATPFIVFGVLLLFSISFLMPFNIWQNDQAQLLAEKQSAVDSINNKQSQIDELQKQLSSITSLTFTQLPIINEHYSSPNTADITVTATPEFNPAYSGTIPCEVESIDLYNHVREFVKISVYPIGVGFKFTYIDPATLPPDFVIVNKYSGTNEVIIMINDMAPGDKTPIYLPIYTMDDDPSIRGTAKLNVEVIFRDILR